ncbi:MAG: carbohydrate ABC transporter substrate-binding protein [Anaerolineae bacterium]|nr:carbohydrate ABC transporter substrate-binding protein [Anaerolineae bacterium]
MTKPVILFKTILFVLLIAAIAACAPAAQPAAPTQAPAPTEGIAPTQPAPTEAAATEPAATTPASGEKASLIIESWRQDDLAVWEDKILPAFMAAHPNIEVKFQPVSNTEYSTSLATKLEAGTAGDLIMVEPFDYRLKMYQDGDLAKLNDLPGLENFSDLALSAWSTDDGAETYGVPLAAVLHGFIYNQDIFEELGLTPPTTEAEFLALLDKVKTDGKYTPLAMGTADSFVPGLLGFQLIGPNYWKGEEGRLALINGTGKFTDPAYINTWAALEDWIPYLPEGYEGVKYGDMQNLFTLGNAAVYPAGSWEVSIFNNQVGDKFKMGAFAPPVPEAGDSCYINDHMDMGMALNANAKNPEAAREFLTWLTTPEFAELWNNSLPGFFSLSNHSVEISDPLAQEFLSWRENCASTPRNSYQIISRGEPNTDGEINRLTTLVMNGQITPDEAGAEVQAGLDKWFKPQ